jgi:hypothetical protein
MTKLSAINEWSTAVVAVVLLGLIAQGCSNGEIASRLVLGQKTVRNHVSNIFSKLQVADRAQAVMRAREAGWDKNNGSAPEQNERLGGVL